MIRDQMMYLIGENSDYNDYSGYNDYNDHGYGCCKFCWILWNKNVVMFDGRIGTYLSATFMKKKYSIIPTNVNTMTLSIIICFKSNV